MVYSRVPMLVLLASALLSAIMVVPVAGQEEEYEAAPVTSMDTGSFHTVVIVRDGGVNVVKDWGANGKGQLGLNDTKDRGDNDGDVGDLLPEVILGNNLQAVAVTAGLRHTAAIMEDNTVLMWGYNAKGQLGVGSLANVGDQQNEMGTNMLVTELGEGLEATSISAGGWHTCIILDGDRLKCWGYNQWGELGLGDKDDRGDDPDEMGDNLDFVDLGSDVAVQSIALGDWHTCVLLTDGNVKCFGKNYAGQLGLDDTEIRGDEENEMGDNLSTVYLGGQQATAIACGEEHSCAILDDGAVRCWGLGASGQLGQENRQNVGDTENDMIGLGNINLGTGRTAIEIAAGGNHTCARLDTDEIKCWGENNYGELGLGDTFYRGIAPSQMGDFLPALELPEGWTLHSLSAGYYHTCALVEQEDTVGNVVCWGANDKGQIGLGISETENIGDDPDEMGENLSPANLEGIIVEEGGDKWYEKQWFYIACGVVGAVLLCCLCLLCGRAHRDNSGRGTGKAHPAATVPPKTAEEGGEEGDAEKVSPASNDTNPNTTGAGGVPAADILGAATSGPSEQVGPKPAPGGVDAAGVTAAPVSTTAPPAAIGGFAPAPTAPTVDSQA